MGPSGSGKTTLLSILGCMLTPTSGTVRVGGQSTAGAGPGGPGQAPARACRLRVPVLSSVSDADRPLDNVRLALDVRGETPRRRSAKAKEALAMVGLAHKAQILSPRAQRRRAAARRDRARHRRQSVGDPRRRADRGAGQRERPGRHDGAGRDRQEIRRAACWSSRTIRASFRSPIASSISRTGASSARNRAAPRKTESSEAAWHVWSASKGTQNQVARLVAIAWCVAAAVAVRRAIRAPEGRGPRGRSPRTSALAGGRARPGRAVVG